jgi:hypothetical protein
MKPGPLDPAPPSKLWFRTEPAKQAEMKYRMKVKTARGAVNALPIPNAIAPNRNRERNETDGLLARERARGSERAGE